MLVLRLYRLLPRQLRRRLMERIPAERQLRIARWLASGPVRSRSASRTHADRIRVRDGGGGAVLADVVTGTTPAAVRAHNLDLVVGLLERAQVPYFCVPGDDLRSTVAVPDHHQQQVLELLRTDPALAGACVRLRDPAGGRVGRRPDSPVIARVYRPVTDHAGAWVLGGRFGCDVEFWAAQGDALVGPRPRRANLVPADDPVVTAPASRFTRFVGEDPDAPRYRTRAAFAATGAEAVTFPVDAVYTWVDGADPRWRQRKAAALAEHGHTPLNGLAANDARYTNRDELRYSLRSLHYFAPWIRHIYLVTDDQLPPWLDLSHPGITLVRHRDIFGDQGRLPTFNSHAIESRLHRIPGLAEHFLYFNDDMFLGCPVVPHTFFHANGLAKFFTSPAQVDPGPASVLDPPVMAAGKNNRRLIAERFGRTLTQKMRHVPYPLRRSVLTEIETELATEVRRTAEHQFRHPDDLSIPSSLAHYWAFLSGRAVPGSIRYTYADLGDPYTPFQLARMLARRDVQVFCLNDTDAGALDAETKAREDALFAEFLSAYFPFPAPFEYAEPHARQRAGHSATELADQLAPAAQS